VSPMTTTSSPAAFNVSVSPMAMTPITSRSTESFTLPPLTGTDLDSRNHSTLEVAHPSRADSDCLPQAVMQDAPELALVEYAHNRDNLTMSVTSQTNTEYASGLEVIPAPPVSNTVTPLHLLGDQPEPIDCPFCLRRSETRVKKKPSSTTQYVKGVTLTETQLTYDSLQAVALLMTTVCGAVAPYMAKWSFDIEHICDNCHNRVMYKAKGKDTRICKAPEAWKEESKYPGVSTSMSPVTR
jgi:DNA-directed RNA polymerase subunit RPC12/RpoP